MTTKPTTLGYGRREAEVEAEPYYEDPRETKGRTPLDMMQARAYHRAISIITAHFGGDPRVFVDGSLPVRNNPSNLRDALWPDVFVSAGVDCDMIRRGTGYNIWEVGKPPDFAMEIGSETTAFRDVRVKPDEYAKMGISEYWLFDPSGGDLYGDLLFAYRSADGEYRPMEMSLNADGLPYGYSEALGLNICAGEDDQLAGRYVPLFQEPESGRYLMDLTESGRALTDEREARRAAEEARAEAEAELAELRARIGRLGDG